MNVFGLGPGELILVLTLALIVFGPRKLPEIGAGLGKAIGQFRKATNELTQEISKEMDADGLKELASLKDVPRDLRGLANSVYQSATAPVSKPAATPAGGAAKDGQQPVAGAPAAEQPSATTGEPAQSPAQEDGPQAASEPAPVAAGTADQTAPGEAPDPGKPRPRLRIREDSSDPETAPEP